MRALTQPNARKGGIALVIVLAFLVLLVGLVVAYLGRTATARQLAHGTFNEIRAEQLARSALAVIVADLKQEIANAPTVGASNVLPQRYPTPVPASTPAIPNLIRRSVYPDTITPASRASNVNSLSPSQNGRSIALSRWNTHFLVPKLNPAGSSSVPITTGFAAPNYWAPDWVIVTRDGPTSYPSWNAALKDSTSANSAYAIGRYGYAIYDEGGLLDFNVAAYPYPSPSPAVTPPSLETNIGRKGVIALADLTAMRLTSTGSTPNSDTLTNLVAWRNYATIRSAGTFPNLTSTDPTATNFINYALDRVADFKTAPITIYNGATDQRLVNRQELIELIRGVGPVFNLLQFLGTFSREANAPTWVGSLGSSLPIRFPLARFDLFASTPPSATNASSIQNYFGLRYIAASGSPSVLEHWEYDGTSGTARQASIPTLTAGNADPDFFTLLKYILPSTASVGELLSIGASLIDQRDSNTDTTWIEYGNAADPTQRAYGVDSNPPPSPAPYPSAGPTPPTVLNRSFRNVGELGYAYRNATTKLDFHTAGSSDAALLDHFTYNTAGIRAGTVSLNTENAPVIAAILRGAFTSEAGATGVTTPQATPAALNIVKATLNQAAIGRQDVARLAGAPTNAPFTSGDEQSETVSRALAEVSQTRTWVLLIDVIAQSGRYPPSAGALENFVVEGEKRYWLHVAIDRFTGKVIDQQLEAVHE